MSTLRTNLAHKSPSCARQAMPYLEDPRHPHHVDCPVPQVVHLDLALTRRKVVGQVEAWAYLTLAPGAKPTRKGRRQLSAALKLALGSHAAIQLGKSPSP